MGQLLGMAAENAQGELLRYDARGNTFEDGPGAPERLVGGAASVACDLERKAWGELQAAVGAKTSTPLRLQGQYWDAETELCNTWLRWFDPTTERWASSEPLGLRGATNLFALGGTPTLALDPHGLTVANHNGNRTPDGKFASPTETAPRSGAAAVAAAQADLARPGWTRVADEQSFRHQGAPGATKGPEESGKGVAARVWDAKYGRGKYDTRLGREDHKITKYFDRHER